MSDIIDIASKEVGYKAYGGNKTKYSAWYGMNGAAWCHMFASWCANQADISTSIRVHIHQKEMILFILNLMAHLTLE